MGVKWLHVSVMGWEGRVMCWGAKVRVFQISTYDFVVKFEWFLTPEKVNSSSENVVAFSIQGNFDFTILMY